MGSKMRKVKNKLGEDRISQMPGEGLLRILSLLDDTVLAVQTTIPSKRWNNLWVSISSLIFECEYNECDDHFMTFVDRVVSLHDSADIRKLYLDYHNEGSREYMLVNDYSRVHTCISTVIERIVVEFYFRLYNTFNITPEVPFLFPESLLKCNTLVFLKLHCSNWHSFSNFPIDACLPRLKVLHIFVNDPEEADFPDNLVTSCPVLEDLTISGTRLDLHINISAPELKSLRMYMSGSKGLYPINAPKLVTFDLSNDMLCPNKYLLENGRSLLNVKLELELDIINGGSADDAIACSVCKVF